MINNSINFVNYSPCHRNLPGKAWSAGIPNNCTDVLARADL